MLHHMFDPTSHTLALGVHVPTQMARHALRHWFLESDAHSPHAHAHTPRPLHTRPACRSMRHPKLRDTLHAIECGPEPVSALAFHPYHQVGACVLR